MSFPIPLPPDYLQKALELNINPPEIQENFIRGSGHGGQKINKTASCIQLIYPRYNIEIKCQKHREQAKNRISAYKILINKIENIVKGIHSAKTKRIFKIRKQKQKRSKRSQEKILMLKKINSERKNLRKKISNRLFDF